MGKGMDGVGGEVRQLRRVDFIAACFLGVALLVWLCCFFFCLFSIHFSYSCFCGSSVFT